MNLEHLQTLRDHLSRQDPADFKMDDYLVMVNQWGTQTDPGTEDLNCHTAGCIAGHVAIICHPGMNERAIRTEMQLRNTDIKTFAAAYLGLSLEDALMIFEPLHEEMGGVRYEHVTLGQAIKLLDLILARGRVYPGMWKEALS